MIYLALALPAIYLAYRLGKLVAYNDADDLLAAHDEAILDSDFVEDQREAGYQGWQ